MLLRQHCLPDLVRPGVSQVHRLRFGRETLSRWKTPREEKEPPRHIKTYGYPRELSKVIEQSAKDVRAMMDAHVFPFVNAEIERLFQKFLAANLPIAEKSGTQKNH